MPKEIHVVQFSQDASKALNVVEVPRRNLEDDEVRIAVHACGVSFPDTLLIQNKYQFKPDLPFSPGSEISGVVAAVGKAVKQLKVGDRVRAGFIYGCFKEEYITSEHMCTLIPDAVGYDECFVGNYVTSYYSLVIRGSLKAGETVLVLGAGGGIGISSIEIAKAFGATVIAAASSDAKLEFCKAAGADFLVNYEAGNWQEKVKEYTKGKGVDICVDPVGDRFTEPAIRSLGWGGRLLVIGFAAGDIPKIPMNLLLLKSAAAIGVFHGKWPAMEPGGQEAAQQEIMGLIAQQKLRPAASRAYAFEDAASALRDMMDRKVTGKVILRTNAAMQSSKL